MPSLIRSILISFVLAVLSMANAVAMDPATVDLIKVAEQISSEGDTAVDNYSDTNGLETGQKLSRLYFDVFEASGMEFALGVYDRDDMLDLELKFSSLINLSMKQKPVSELQSQWSDLKDHLARSALAHQDKQAGGFWTYFLQSLLIMLREGIEAMLVVTALITYLRRSGAADQIRGIWTGVWLALLASVAIAWWLNQLTLSVSGTRREAMEGITMLVASAVMIYVSYWLFSKSQADRWQSFVKNQLEKSIGNRDILMLSLTAFLAVFREGAETVLFYQALVAGSSTDYTAIFSGLAVACVLLVGLYYVLKFVSVKLPVGIFFKFTGCFLFVMAFIFLGKGILELQVIGWIDTTLVRYGPKFPTLGIFPTIESLGAQALLILIAVVPFFILGRRREFTRNSP